MLYVYSTRAIQSSLVGSSGIGYCKHGMFPSSVAQLVKTRIGHSPGLGGSVPGMKNVGAPVVAVAVGTATGALVGAEVASITEAVGLTVGDPVSTTASVGLGVGADVAGSDVRGVGTFVGLGTGKDTGLAVGLGTGAGVAGVGVGAGVTGSDVGPGVGTLVGLVTGAETGLVVGLGTGAGVAALAVGAGTGASVGDWIILPWLSCRIRSQNTASSLVETALEPSSLFMPVLCRLPPPTLASTWTMAERHKSFSTKLHFIISNVMELVKPSATMIKIEELNRWRSAPRPC